ncbi:thioredoxin domain-containing protein [Paenibacillus sediminis]|uniref:Thiol-disulfide isomerase/thioredoxin n=1 Tax=Paenibacillus sediminis TaxID=664909 RepID=A0ABS4H062_9BACL|nr:thioredoxin domain-containing protein [Paenibacillus sediminis]MBP1935904.1 thiol-disulfide isomerase/thioredoxin [Paenibacillus sediminis]
MKEMGEKELFELIEKGNDPAAVFLYTPFCGTCKMTERMLEVVEQLISEEIIYRVNVNMTPNLVMRYKISSVPCIMLFDQNRDHDPKLLYQMNSVQHLLAEIRGVIE